MPWNDLAPVNITNTPSTSSSMAFPVAAAIGAGGSIISSLIGNRGRRRAEDRARNWNLEQWHRQNKYNHPLEQMARLEAAGLNPNMIYGSSPGSAVGNAGAVHPGKAPEYKFADPVVAGAALPVQQAQHANLSSQSIKNLAEARKTGIDAGISKENLLRLEMTLGEYLEEATGRAQEAKYKGKSAKIKYGIENATQKDQIRKIVAEADLTGLRKDIEKEIRDRAVDGGWIKGDTIGNILNGYLGVTNDTPQWKKNYIATSPAVAAVIRMLPPQARAAFLMYYGGSALVKAFDSYMSGK